MTRMKYVHEIVLRVTTTSTSDPDDYKYELDKALGLTDWDGDDFEVVSAKNVETLRISGPEEE